MEDKSSASTHAGESCMCREAMRCLDRLFRVRSEEVRQHLRNSRIEFLKAIRTVVDERIQHLSQTAQPGTKLNVE